MIPTLEIDEQGNITTLYTDEINLYELGKVHNVHRASYIEFDENLQEWMVIHAKTGNVVYKHKNRAEAINWEIKNFSPGGNLFNGGFGYERDNY